MVLDILGKTFEVPEGTALIKLVKQSHVVEVSSGIDKYGSEIVYCGEDEYDGYIGWTTRENAIAHDYKIECVETVEIVPEFS